MKNEIEREKRKIIDYVKKPNISIRILANMLDDFADMAKDKTAKFLIGKEKKVNKKLKLN